MATLGIDALTFNATTDQDVLGANGARAADGKFDASFTLDVSGAQAVKEISIKNETTGKAWSTSPGGATELLLVRDGNGTVINTGSRMPITPVLLAATFDLVISDAASSIPKDSTFLVSVVTIDNKTITAKTSAKSQAPASPITSKSMDVIPAKPAPIPTPTVNEGITTFETRGISEFDLANTGEKIGASGKDNYQFDIKFAFKDMTVRGLKLVAATDSKKADWDTIPGNNIPIVAVIDTSKNIVNKADGSVSFNIKGEAVYSLLVHDKTMVLSDPSVKTKVIITLSDGRMLEKEAVKGRHIVGENSMVAEYRGIGKYDFVGQSEKIESNMNPDRFITMTVNTNGTVTGIRIKDTKKGTTWDTIPSNKNPLCLVMDSKGEKLNRADGTVSIPINGVTELNIGFDEENDKNTGPYQVTFVLSNGQLMEATAASASASSPAEIKAPAAPAAERAVKFTTPKPLLLNVDLVGKNKKPGASGAKDMMLGIQTTGKGSIVAMVLAASDGGGWDTLSANNGRWLLGVRSAGKLINAKNGTVKILINGTKTFELFMQDNGKLAAKTGKFLLTTTWNNGEVTETELKW